MYTHQDFEELTAQLKKRSTLLLIPCVLLFAALVYSLVIRLEWLTMVLTLMLGTVMIFGYTMFLSPVRLYRRHVEHGLKGRVRQTTGHLKEMEETPIWREGLMVVPMILNINDMKNEEDDRLFYFDGRQPRPDWQQGDKITLSSYDKLVTDWEKA